MPGLHPITPQPRKGRVRVAGIASRYGQHLVLVQARQSERVPKLDQIRARVRQDVIAERRQQARRSMVDEVLEDYRLRIDWPEASRPDAVVMREVRP